LIGKAEILGSKMNENKQTECSVGQQPQDISLAQRVLLALVRLYQLTLSPMVGGQCRFYPTCSHYAAGAIRTHGARRGVMLAGKRLAKCQPLHPGGVDLVPGTETAPATPANQGIHS
jgi:putative membrane protein insertion efficiency factor